MHAISSLRSLGTWSPLSSRVHTWLCSEAFYTDDMIIKQARVVWMKKARWTCWAQAVHNAVSSVHAIIIGYMNWAPNHTEQFLALQLCAIFHNQMRATWRSPEEAEGKEKKKTKKIERSLDYRRKHTQSTQIAAGIMRPCVNTYATKKNGLCVCHTPGWNLTRGSHTN